MDIFFSPLGGFAAQFFDNNGVPLAGGKIFTYLAGTTTPQTSYTSSSGATPHTNPILLDSAGRVPGGEIWLTNGTPYKFTIETASGVLIGTYDNISSTNAQDILFTQSGAGAVTTNVQDKLRRFRIDVKDYGATGDGVTNDTAAIQTAIAAASARAASQETELYFPDGEYRYTTLTVNAGGVYLVGDGARLIKTTSTGDGIVFDGVDRKFGGGVNGLYLGASVENLSGSLLYVLKYTQFQINVTIKPFPAAGFNGITIQQSSAVQVLQGTSVEGQKGDGLKILDCIDVYLNSSRYDGNGIAGVKALSVSGLYAYGVTCFFNDGDNWVFDVLGGGTFADANGFLFLTNCVGDQAGGHNWSLTRINKSVLTGCWGSSQKNTTANLHGFVLDGCFETEFVGCMAFGNNGCGWRSQGVGSVDIIINGGQFNDNGKVAGSTRRVGISVGNSSEVSITSSLMTDSQMVKTQLYGLGVDSGVITLNMIGADMRGNATGPYLFEGTIPGTFGASDCLTGESPVYASATTVTISPFIDNVQITGSTNIFDISPTWQGRTIVCDMTGAAGFVDQAGGSSFALPTNVVTPGNQGTIGFVYRGTKWLHMFSSQNDGV
jgi:hypothetical protein